MKVLLGVSNRHIHLTKEDFKLLFGEKATLKVLKKLIQPEQYASTSTVTIKTKKNFISNVRVIGPIRDYTQVEISKTDAYNLGINPPIKDAGDLTGAEEIEIEGPVGSIKRKCAILATRHIHITKEKQKELGLENVKEVSVSCDGIKGVIFKNVQLKVQDNAVFELHLDTDDANGALLKTGDYLTIIK